MPTIRGRASILVLVTATAMAPALVGPAGTAQATHTAAAAQTLTVQATADTTYTPITADGDNGVKATLASCPQSCEGNANGERQPVLGFTVGGLPATATNIRASLEVYTWTATSAGVTAYPASGGSGASGPGTWANRPTLGAALASTSSLVAGYNGFDVSRAVTGNGTFTFALRQQTPTTRTYWASREHATGTIRPRLVITYDTGAAPWTLVWSDEFDGSSLNTAKWHAENNSHVDYDRACITNRPQNVFVADGMLTMRVRKEQYTCGGGGTRQYTTSYLTTKDGRASFTYGRFETRAKSPTGPTNSRGLWPAFWMRPDDKGFGEIDVVELPGGAGYYKAATSSIFYGYDPVVKQDHRYTFPTGHPADGFHTYTTEWEPNMLRWYIDGVQVWQRDRTTTTWFDEVFNKPYHLRLSHQVGGWLGDPDTTTVLPADFQVDYVRVWQRPAAS